MSEHETVTARVPPAGGQRLPQRPGTVTSSSSDLYADPTDGVVGRLRALVHVYSFLTVVITFFTTLAHFGIIDAPFEVDTTFNYMVLAPGAVTCLAKDPNDRPQTAHELRRRLSAIPLTSPWDRDRALGWWTAHVPALVASAHAKCKAPAIATQAVRKRPAPVVRNTVDLQ